MSTFKIMIPSGVIFTDIRCKDLCERLKQGEDKRIKDDLALC